MLKEHLGSSCFLERCFIVLIAKVPKVLAWKEREAFIDWPVALVKCYIQDLQSRKFCGSLKVAVAGLSQPLLADVDRINNLTID